MKDYSKIVSEYNTGMGKLAEDIPGTVKAFSDLVGAATQDEALSKKVKELIAFGIAITVRCDGCIAAHASSVLEAGATRQEVAEMIGVAILMGGGPSSVYGVEAMRAYEQCAAAQPAAAQ
jgi:AhpD family alkylhydroperoxidase